MGFYIRKSFSIWPLRLNLSNSGLGTSVVVRGLRFRSRHEAVLSFTPGLGAEPTAAIERLARLIGHGAAATPATKTAAGAALLPVPTP